MEEDEGEDQETEEDADADEVQGVEDENAVQVV